MCVDCKYMDALDKMYQTHHRSGARYDASILKSNRGAFLRKNIGTGKKVLDIGCRDGALTSEYCAGNDVVGVDIDSKALEKTASYGVRTMQFNLTDVWPLDDEAFDRVVAGEVLEHLYFPELVLKEVKRVLRPGGLFIGSVPNAFNLKNRFRLFLGQKRFTPLSDPTHINHFSRTELLEMLSKDFEEVEIVPLGKYKILDSLWPGMFSFGLLFRARRA